MDDKFLSPGNDLLCRCSDVGFRLIEQLLLLVLSFDTALLSGRVGFVTLKTQKDVFLGTHIIRVPSVSTVAALGR